MDRNEFLKTLTIEELNGDVTKHLVMKLQEDARVGYIKKDEIVTKLQSDENLLKDIVGSPEVVASVKLQLEDGKKKIETFTTDGLAYLKEKKVPENQAKVMLQKLGEANDHDLETFKNWYEGITASGLTFKFQAGASENNGDDTDITPDPKKEVVTDAYGRKI